jgi:thymidylate synthase
MKQYNEALKQILENGKEKTDRTGTGTLSIFGMQLRFDLRLGFPAVTTKKLAWRAVVSELLWFLEGSSSELRLKEILYGTSATDRSTIWSANANSEYWKPMAKTNGDLGRIYGVQWRNWRTPNRKWLNSSTWEPVVIDQLQQLIDGIKTNPESRRHILTAWNPGELDMMALPPCHVMCQFDVTDGYLSCQLYQRSCDMFLGVPFNIASYSLLTHIIAKECGLKVGEFIWSGGDCHIYKDHIDAVNEQLSREPKPLPTLMFADKSIFEYSVDDFVLDNYNHHPAIVAPMSV